MEINSRYCKVILEKFDKKGNTEDRREFVNNLNVRFTYQRFLGNGMHSKGKVSICGLTKDAIDKYTSYFSQDIELAKRKTVTVIAGYDDKERGYGEILSGSIIIATPTIPPDVWLNCEVINQYEAKLKSKTYTFTGTHTLKEILQWAQKEANLKNLDLRIKNKRYLNATYTNFTFEGNKFDFIGRIGAIFCASTVNDTDKHNGITTYTEGDTLVADYQDLLQAEYNRKGKPKIVSKNSKELQLVGLPQPMWAGQAVAITTLLNPTIKTGEVIELQSDLIKSLNGYYYVFNITYNGEFRGNQWYSQFLCRRLK